MPMRAELSTPAMPAGWQAPAAEVARPRIPEILRSPDFVAVVVLSAIGLVASLCLTLLFPFSADAAGFLAQFT